MWFNDDGSPDDGDGDGDGDDSVDHLDSRSFEALEDTVDRFAAQGQKEPASQPPAADSSPIRSEEEFETAVRSAIDGLPDEVQQKLQDVVITVSDDGQKEHAYGMYVPGSGRDDGYRWLFFGMGRRASLSQIVIYRDTLLRDYGRDPALLRAKITETVRHEVGHALGFDEAGVRRLGL
jgi:predicted Zn-dependent protease with MMP-like domain